MDLNKQKRRLAWAMGLTGLCALVAVGSLVGSAMTHTPWLFNVVVAAIVAGVLAQVWFIVGVVRDR